MYHSRNGSTWSGIIFQSLFKPSNFLFDSIINKHAYLIKDSLFSSPHNHAILLSSSFFSYFWKHPQLWHCNFPRHSFGFFSCRRLLRLSAFVAAVISDWEFIVVSNQITLKFIALFFPYSLVDLFFGVVTFKNEVDTSENSSRTCTLEAEVMLLWGICRFLLVFWKPRECQLHCWGH